jgi:hypothetical protein
MANKIQSTTKKTKTKPRKMLVRRTQLGRRPKYERPYRLSAIVEGTDYMSLEDAARMGVNGKTDMTGVIQDALREYKLFHNLPVHTVAEYDKKYMKEVVIP